MQRRIASFLVAAALSTALPGAAAAGKKSGAVRPARGLGAAYSSGAVRARPAATSATPAASIGRSRQATSRAPASARPPAPVTGASRTIAPAKGGARIATRALAARTAASQAEEAAVRAAGDSETAFAEHAGAVRTVERARTDVRGATERVRVAKSELAVARTAAGRLRLAASDAAGGLSEAVWYRDQYAAASKKKGSWVVNAFMAPFRLFGGGGKEERAKLEAARSVAEQQVQVRARALDDASRSAAAADAAVAIATDAAAAAERAVVEPEARLAAAETAVARATAKLTASQKSARTARKTADQAHEEATVLETKAHAAAQRAEAARARIDQHRIRVTRNGTAAKERYRAAASRVNLRSLIESKPGEVSQDALAAAPEAGLYAIADGVTHSDFSGPFARALVRAWTDAPPSGEQAFDTWLEAVQAEWKDETDPLIEPLRTKYYNRNKTWAGHAAFVGARIDSSSGRRRLRLIGTGDTVAFLVRDGAIRRSFPLERADQFSDIVEALPSTRGGRYKVTEKSWPVREGDEVFMATDALAAWIFGEVEAGRDPFPTLRGLTNQRQMNDFVAQARDGRVAGHGEMHVDDTALLRFTIPAPGTAD